MNFGCGNGTETDPACRDLSESNLGHWNGRGRSAGDINWPRSEPATRSQPGIGEEQWFCLFRGDAGPMAVSVESVAAVLETDMLVRLAWSPPQLVGLCPYHREVVPVVLLSPASGGGETSYASGRGPAAGTDPSEEKPGMEDRTPCVVLILRTEQGAWGIRVDAENTIMSREWPESHPPHIEGDGPVIVGMIRRSDTCYGILDAEATWHGLASSVGRWYGLISQSKPSSPAPSGEELRGTDTGASKETREA